MKNKFYYCIIYLFFSFEGFYCYANPQDIDNSSLERLITKGDSLYGIEKYRESAMILEEAYNKAVQLDSQKVIIRYGLKLQHIEQEFLGNSRKARNIINSLYSYCQKKNDTIGIVRSLIVLGDFEKSEYNYFKALMLYNKAFDLLQFTKDKAEKWRLHYSIARLYTDAGDNDLARQSYAKGLKSLPETKLDYYKTLSYINISSTFEKADSLIYYSEKALKTCSSLQEKRLCDLVIGNLAWGYTLKEEYLKALKLIEDDIDVANLKPKYNDTFYSSLMHTLGIIHFNLKHYDKAIFYLEKAIEAFKNENSISLIIRAQEDLAKSYEELGDFKKSTELLKALKPLQVKTEKNLIEKEVAKIKYKALISEQENKILQLEEEKDKVGALAQSSKIINYLLSVFVILILIAFIFYQYRSKIRYYRVQQALSLNRMKSLRSTMNPHFLFNSFSTIQNYILKEEDRKAMSFMSKLSDLIRKVLDSSDDIFICFNDELELIKSYIMIERERFKNKFEVRINIDNNITTVNPVIPSMLIQPYVENAINHGFVSDNMSYILELEFKKHENLIICIIRDNGIGRRRAQIVKQGVTHDKHLSIATDNIKERVKILNKINKYNIDLVTNDLYDLSKQPIGTEIIIKLPLKILQNESRT